MMLTSLSTLEVGRFDVTTQFPPLGPPVEPVIQAGHLQGGSFQNTYGVDDAGRPRVRRVGAIELTRLKSVDGSILSAVAGPGAGFNQLLLGFAFDGFIEQQDNSASVTKYTAGKAGLFITAGFQRFNPVNWDTVAGVFDDPLITWTLSPTQTVTPGDGEQLAEIQQSNINRNSTNFTANIRAQGDFLLTELDDPLYPVTTPGQTGFLDVLTGYERFDPNQPIEEGIFLSFSQTVTLRFLSGVTSGAFAEINPDQHEALEALAKFAFEDVEEENDAPVGERDGTKYYFATSINDPSDALQGFYVAGAGGQINQFDGFAGGDLFENQDDVMLHPVLQGTRLSDRIIISPDKGNQSTPYIHVVERETGDLVYRFLAYNAAYRGGVRVATGDLTGDGIDEIVTSPGRGHRPLVRVFNQQGQLLAEFLAFDPDFTSGIDVAVGDVTGNGRPDIVVGMSLHGSKVRVFENMGGLSFSPFQDAFEAFPDFLGGVTVEVADMGTFLDGTVVAAGTPDGRSEILVGNEAGMRSTVHVFDTSGSSPQIVRTFQPFSDDSNFYSLFLGGVSITAARVDSDPIPDLIVGAGNRGGSRVQVLNGRYQTVLTPTFVAYTDTETNSYNAPVRVAAVDTKQDGRADRLTVAQGSDGSTRAIRSFDPFSAYLIDEFFETSPDFGGAYFVEALALPDLTGGNGEPSGEAAVDNLLAAAESGSAGITAPESGVAGSSLVPMSLSQWRLTRWVAPLARSQATIGEDGLAKQEYVVEAMESDPADDRFDLWLRRRGSLLAARRPLFSR